MAPGIGWRARRRHVAGLIVSAMALLLFAPAPSAGADEAVAKVCPLADLPSATHGRSADPLEALDPCAATIVPGIEIETPHTRCTAGFLYYHDAPNVSRVWYLSTAGHCFGDAFDCEDGSADIVKVDGLGRIGVKVFCTSRGVGTDFALVRIDDTMVPHTAPAICGWGGPDAISTDDTGVVHHYGHGLGYSKTHATRMRTGYETYQDSRFFRFMGTVDSGDSGSPVRHESGAAVGIATHASFDAFGILVHSAPYAYGTSIERGISLAEPALGFRVSLATAPLA